MQWNSITLSPEIRAYFCKNSLRVCMPEGTCYDGYSFFHPLSLVYGESELIIRYSDVWVFKLTKSEKKDDEWVITDTVELTGEQLKIELGDLPLTRKPMPLEPLDNVQALSELLDE